MCFERAAHAGVGSVVCEETHRDEQSKAWVMGHVVKHLHNASSASVPQDPAKDAIHFDKMKANDPILHIQLYEPLAAWSITIFVFQATVEIVVCRLRVINVQLEEARAARGSHHY